MLKVDESSLEVASSLASLEHSPHRKLHMIADDKDALADSFSLWLYRNA